METLVLLSVPGIAILLLVAAVGAWIGHTTGRNAEAERKAQALAEADKESRRAIDELNAENAKKIDVLNKANSNEIDGLKQSHSAQIDQINGAHQTLVDSLKSGFAEERERLAGEHSSTIDRLNASNSENINQLEQRRQEELQALRGEHAATVEQLQADRDRRLREAEQRSADEQARLNGMLAEVRAERDALATRNTEIGQELAELRDEIKEAKMNNMFSVSKSGEKLIRVVRSVQELASELDETSRTVTGGEYSFFEQIKDQRDRDTVLSLAAGGKTVAGDEADADDDLDDAPTIARADDGDDSGDGATTH